ncbi:hypothetical protein [Xanthomonas axonopodis]
MKFSFVVLVLACLWGFASSTPLAATHDTRLLWVVATVVTGGLFWALMAIHVADAYTLWRWRELNALEAVYRRSGWDGATFVALLVLFALMRNEMERAGVSPQLLPWTAMALLACAARLVLILLLGSTGRRARHASMAALATCLVALWFACFAIAQLGMHRLSIIESIWFEVTSIIAGVATYVGVKQTIYALRTASLRTTPSLAHGWAIWTGAAGRHGSTWRRDIRKKQANIGRRKWWR